MMISTFFDWQYSENFKKTVNDFANALWDILSRAKTYSFAKDPLPIFYLLHAAFCDYDIAVWDDGVDLHAMKDSNLSFPENSNRRKLLKLFPENCTKSLCEDWEVIDDFCWMLNISTTGTLGDYDFQYEFRGAKYKYIHPLIVDFFIQKYIRLCHTEHELSEIFLDKLWNIINENDEPGNSSDYYIPYSGLSSIALHDINNSYSVERVSYYCEEDNQILSLIAKVRLCALGHNYNIVKSSTEIEKDRFSNSHNDRIAMVSVPPFEMKIHKEDSAEKDEYIYVAEDVITKFLDDKRFSTAYIVLPIRFTTESVMEAIRKRIIDSRIIKSITHIPEGSFASISSSGIILCLDKENTSNFVKINLDENNYYEESFENLANQDYLLTINFDYSNAKQDETKFQYSFPVYKNAIPKKLDDIFSKHNESEQEEATQIHNNSFNSDLLHCLAPIFGKIKNTAEGFLCDDVEENPAEVLKVINDNVDYVMRIIQSFGANFESQRMLKQELGVNDFFNSYYSSLKSYNSIFSIDYRSMIQDDTTFNINEDAMRIMLDTILDNAYRHGFKKRKSIDAQVGIFTSCRKIGDKEYVLIEVCNNGDKFPQDFTIEKFVTRGEHCGESGHSGLGGHHIYSIIKKHEGYLNFRGSAKWSIIYDILIPIEFISDGDLNNIIDYNNAMLCI